MRPLFNLVPHLVVIGLSLLIALPAAAAANSAASVMRVDNGRMLTHSAEQELCTTSLLVRLAPGAEYRIYDLVITADEPSSIIVSASSTALSAAVLSGQIQAEGVTAAGGQLLAWSIDTKAAPQVFFYDIGRLLASSSLASNEELRAELAPALARQQRDLYWGRLEQVGANLQAPVLPLQEAIRRDVMLTPVMIELRRAAAGDEVALKQLVAHKFVSALAARDKATVRDLLDPALFQPQQASGQEWQNLRARFADRLVAGRTPAQVRGAAVELQSGGRWTVAARGHKAYALQLSESAGSFPFVQSLEAR